MAMPIGRASAGRSGLTAPGRNVVANLTARNAAASPGRARWEPKFPEFSLVPDADVPTRIDPDSEGWIDSPATSAHVHAFKKWFPFTPTGRALSGGTYQIFVRFRETDTQPMTEYVYKWKSQAEAQRVWGLLTTDPHPGEVIHAEMIEKSVPYMRIGQGA